MQHQNPAGRKGWMFAVLAGIGFFTALAWTGQLDTLSADYVDRALAGAGIVYATARGINALVSVLQGTELDMVMLTFTIGELLDPLNDLIERFSGILLIALGSLAMQKILLGLVSHDIFNVLLSILALGTGIALVAGKQRLYKLLLRPFIVVVFFRFSLGLVVLANNWVDMYFFANDDMRRQLAMESFEGELRQLSTMAGINGPSGESINTMNEQITGLEKTRTSEQQSLEERIAELNQAERRLDELLAERPMRKKLNPFSKDSAAIAQAKQRVARLEAEVDSITSTLASVEQALAKQRENLACMRKQAAGEACSFFAHLTAGLSPREIATRINALQDRVADFSENVIALLVSLLLKSVVIPLLFFYVLVKLAGGSWHRLR